jgi:catechol 2,3-dioxygenase-like lactoylglutathione lyase family enzyme
MPPRLTGILETVLYYRSGERAAMERFYLDVLGLRLVEGDDASLFFRVGGSVYLLFDAEIAARKRRPPAHGASGPVHTCFLVPADDYKACKRHVEGCGVSLLDEIEWGGGLRSFYFNDPAGNVLEIANGDLWPP